jgi:hypothetical protein
MIVAFMLMILLLALVSFGLFASVAGASTATGSCEGDQASNDDDCCKSCHCVHFDSVFG